ncbi:uncharacterized protein BKA78DRAFT_158599 [Phyllosticta capitalensis]|uniref:uncharacterized protein n=1 Tax=Phyllosticta capitalensis TaxID=121624 RepID=UPI003131D3FD
MEDYPITKRSRIDHNSDNCGVIATNTSHGQFIGTQTNNHYFGQSTTSELEGLRPYLSPLDFSGSHEQVYDEVAPGTCQWFLQSEEFTSWRSNQVQNLWCFGKPGAGKSSIVSIVVQELRRQEHCQVAFLYLSYKERQGRDFSVRDLLGCLANQLIDQLDPTSPLPSCVRTQLSNSFRRSPPGESQLEQLLVDLASPNTFFVVDALDELSSQECCQSLLNRLRQIKASLLVTSRQKPMEGFSAVEVEAQDQDVYNYIQQICERNKRFTRMIQWDNDLGQDIKYQITKKAAGIFLLARFHVQAILQSLRPADVRNALVELPSTRDLMYENTLRRIKAQDSIRANCAIRTIGWVLHADRPLKIQELRHALLIQEMQESNEEGSETQEDGQRKSDTFLDHGRLFQETDILAFSHGLVEVDKEDDTVRFIHFTTCEFFERFKDAHFPAFDFQISMACVSYLGLTRLEHSGDVGDMDGHFDDPNTYKGEYNEVRALERLLETRGAAAWRLVQENLASPHFQNNDLRGEISRLLHNYPNGSRSPKKLPHYLKILLYPFVTYAGKHLTHHLRAVVDTSRSAVESKLRNLLEHSRKRQFLAELLEFTRWGYYLIDEQSAITFAAFFGSAQLVDHFCRQRCDNRTSDRNLRNSLRIAIHYRFHDVVQELLHFGVVDDFSNIWVHMMLVSAAPDDRIVSLIIGSMYDGWRKCQETRDTKRPSKSMVRVFEALGKISDIFLFNSFEDATDNTLKETIGHNPSCAQNESILDLDSYFQLLRAAHRDDAATILSLVDAKRVDINQQPLERKDPKAARARKLFIWTCLQLCERNHHSKAAEIFQKHCGVSKGRLFCLIFENRAIAKPGWWKRKLSFIEESGYSSS